MSNHTIVYHFYNYDPSEIASSIAAVLFGLITIIHVFQLYRYKAWIMTPLVVGSLIMTIGYIARCISIINVKALAPFIIQGIALLIPPVFFAATIYTLLGRIATFLEAGNALSVKPKNLTRIFVSMDIFSFFIQGGGAGYLAQGTEQSFKTGGYIVVGGLAVQLIAFSCFIIVAIVFHRRVVAIHHQGAARLMKALYLTSALILIRSIYRLIEFAQGNGGYLQSKELLFYIFDTIFMFLVVCVYVVIYPARSLRRDNMAMKLQNHG